MSAENNVNIIGNLTRDVELRHTPSGSEVANFGIATTRGYGQNKKTVFVDITVWGKRAVNAQKYIQKGSQVAIHGELDFDNWEDNSGQRRNKLSVVALDIKFLNRLKSENSEQTQWNPTTEPQQDQKYDWNSAPEMEEPPF